MPRRGILPSMPTLVAMLRGINLGSRRVKMDLLRELCVNARFECVKTYLQSGNVVFRARSQNIADVKTTLERAIEKEFAFHSEVIIRNVAELRAVVAANPFGKEAKSVPGKVVVTFLGEAVSAANRKALRAMEIAPEQMRMNSRELYFYFPSGQARTKLSWPKVEKLVGPAFTSRNWNTVTGLLDLALTIDADA